MLKIQVSPCRLEPAFPKPALSPEGCVSFTEAYSKRKKPRGKNVVCLWNTALVGRQRLMISLDSIIS